MQWDLGFEGLAVLFVMALGFALVSATGAGPDLSHRIRTGIITAMACFLVGLLTSEVWFGWATEDDLQPNIDGLSFDEVLLSGLVTTAIAVAIARRIAHRPANRATPAPRHAVRRSH